LLPNCPLKSKCYHKIQGGKKKKERKIRDFQKRKEYPNFAVVGLLHPYLM